MKKIEAVIQPFKLDDVKKALLAAGVEGMTIYEVKGLGHEKESRKAYRGREYAGGYPKVKIEIIVSNERVRTVVETLRHAARTGKIGDGKIFVSTMEESYRIREENIDEYVHS